MEINNLGTKKRVVADAVKFVPAETGTEPFVMDDPQAEGGWQLEIPARQCWCLKRQPENKWPH